MIFFRQGTSPSHWILPLSNNILVNGLWQIQGHLKNAFLVLGEGGAWARITFIGFTSSHRLTFQQVDTWFWSELFCKKNSPLAVFQIHVGCWLARVLGKKFWIPCWHPTLKPYLEHCTRWSNQHSKSVFAASQFAWLPSTIYNPWIRRSNFNYCSWSKHSLQK